MPIEMSEVVPLERQTDLLREHFPNADKLVCVDGRQAKALAYLYLHRHDVDYAARCLAAISVLPSDPQSEFLADAFWVAAIVSFTKCFGQNEARSALDPHKIFDKTPVDTSDPRFCSAFDFYEQLQAVRDKHIVHDESVLANCTIGAALRGDSPLTVEVFARVSHARMRHQDTVAFFAKLVHVTSGWLNERIDGAQNALASQLAASPEATRSLPELTAVETPPVGAEMIRRTR